MRRRRTMASISVWSSAWPMCRDPVTFGGGITMVNGGAADRASAVKYPAAAQASYRRLSTSAGLYCVGRLVSVPVVTAAESSGARTGDRLTARSGRLLPRRPPGDVPWDQRRVNVLQHHVRADDDLLDVLAARHLVHHREKDLLEDRPQPAGTRAAEDRLVGHRLEGVVGELQVYSVELEQPPVLPDERVARLGQDPDQRLAVQVVHAGDHRQPSDELGDHPELQQVLRHHVGERVGHGLVGLDAKHGAEAHAALADPLLDDLLQASERATADEQHVRGVDLDELLMRMLAPALRRYRRRRAFEDLQQRLLHALAGDVAGNRRVLALARDFVDLVDVDDPGLCLLDVVVGRLDELEQDVLDVLADVSGLGQRGRVGNGERYVQQPGEGLGQQRLTRPRRPEQQDVRLG